MAYFFKWKAVNKNCRSVLDSYIFPYLDHTFFMMGMKKMMSRNKTYEHIGIKDRSDTEYFSKF